MKFDFAIGNPPYQEEVENNGRANPVYNHFMDAAFEVADKVELIHPARFLFNAGQTPKAWNRKMLYDEHFKVLDYAQNSKDIFPSAELTGGICITYRDATKVFGAIEEFSQFEEINSVIKKIQSRKEKSFSEIIVGAVPYRFSETLAKEHPEWADLIGKSFDLRSNALDKLYKKAFFDKCPEDGRKYVKILGLLHNKRVELFIREDYIVDTWNIMPHYNLLLSESNGAAGTLGKPVPARIIGEAIIAGPGSGQTQTFISVGAFDDIDQMDAANKYLKTKFLRALLGVRKVTQHNPKETWKLIPLQNFTSDSDINWNTSIRNIDRQLYKKYNLTDEEINFIETHVKEME